METLRAEANPKSENEERLTWYKPDIQRLTISIDTADNPGSGADGPTFGAVLPP